MPLVLTLHRAREPANQQRESRTLEEGRLTIGRGPANGWVLQDPAQHLSKTHCIVAAGPAGFTLTDTSSNGVFLNGSKTRLERDSTVRIEDGDEFVIGDYLVRVSVVEALTSRAVRSSASAPSRGAAPALERDDPFGLDEFLPAPPPPPPPPPAPAPPAARFDPFSNPRDFERDDPFGAPDDFAAPRPARATGGFGEPPAPRQARVTPDPFEDAPGADAFGAADDDLFSGKKPDLNWQGPSQRDDSDAPNHAFRPPQATPLPNMDAWDDLLGDEPPPGYAAPTPQPPPAPPAPPPPPPAFSAPAPPAAPPPAAAPPPPSPAADGARLLRAFLEGAGVGHLDVSAQDGDAYLRQAGELFALMVESLREVLISRATVKGEFGVDQTMLRSRNNNALKFSVTPEDAVTALLQPSRPGYMPPLDAAREAFDDIRIHQLAVMAGVQAALFNLLKTFDPAALEARLQKGGMVESLIPASRRAKLWEAFCATYKDIARDADADFQTVFGREFARAYSEQARKS